MKGMQAPTRHRLKLAGTLALVFVHAWFAALAFFDRLSFTQPSRYELIELVASSDVWGWIFAGIGTVLLVLLAFDPWKHHIGVSRACSLSAAFLGTWAFFTLLWGLTTEFPVSLAVFGPAVFSVVGAQVLAVSWAQKE